MSDELFGLVVAGAIVGTIVGVIALVFWVIARSDKKARLRRFETMKVEAYNKGYSYGYQGFSVNSYSFRGQVAYWSMNAVLLATFHKEYEAGLGYNARLGELEKVGF